MTFDFCYNNYNSLKTSLENFLTLTIILQEGFLPSSDWRFNYAKAKLPSTNQVVNMEDHVICPYYGPNNLKLAPTYTPFRDLNNGDFYSHEAS
jgi:hypothetical protein